MRQARRPPIVATDRREADTMCSLFHALSPASGAPDQRTPARATSPVDVGGVVPSVGVLPSLEELSGAVAVSAGAGVTGRAGVAAPSSPAVGSTTVRASVPVQLPPWGRSTPIAMRWALPSGW